MKFLSGTFVAAVLAAALATGCNEAPRTPSMVLTPGIHLSPPQTIGAGESIRFVASTENIVAPLTWACTPNDGKLMVEKDLNGQTVLFTSNSPGTYRITASAKGATGADVTAETSATVEPKPMAVEDRH